jgi:glutamyl-tRNA reductase
LSALFRAVIHAGKRVRTETAIGVNPASVSSVAAGLAGQLLGDLSQKRVLLVGAGEMGAIAVRALLKRGIGDVIVANRTYENAEQLAQAWAGRAISFQKLPEAIGEADIVIASTGAPHTILNRSLVEPALARRPEQPLLIIDIALPRDVDDDVLGIPNVHLHNLDDLQDQAEENVHERELEIPRVEAILEEEAGKFLAWFGSLDAVSTISTLREEANQVRLKELERLFNRLELDEREQELVAIMSHRLINKILHKPTIRLKKEAAAGNGAVYIEVARQLFALDNKVA